MKRLVERGMEAGAWGISSGLIYVPGRYADTSELIELSRVVQRHGGLYASHIRNEGAGLLESIDEAIAIGKGAGIPVHISHLKASGKAYWGTVGPALTRIAAARKAGQIVTADQYPYIASSTQLAAMVVPHWAIQGNADDFARLAADPNRGQALRREIERGARRARRRGLDPDRAVRAPAGMGRARPRSRSRSARERLPLEIVLDIQRHGGAQAISFGMSEDDVREVMRHDFVATASDGSTHLPGRRRSAPSACVRDLSAQGPLRPRRQGPLARAGDPLLFRLAGRDSRASRPGRDPCRARAPTSSSSTRPLSAMRRPSTSRPGMPPE